MSELAETEEQPAEARTALRTVQETPVEKSSKAALRALVDLVATTLDQDGCAHRFQDAARLCMIGREILQVHAETARDLAETSGGREGMWNDQADVAPFGGLHGPNVVGQAPRMYRPMMAPMAMGFGDGLEQARHTALDAQPMIQTQTEANRAAVAASEASELAALTELASSPAILEKEPIKARISQLLEHLEVRNALRRRERDRVADPELSRGHQADRPRQREDDPPGVRADPPGRGGDAPAPEEGHQERPGFPAVGFGA